MNSETYFYELSRSKVSPVAGQVTSLCLNKYSWVCSLHGMLLWVALFPMANKYIICLMLIRCSSSDTEQKCGLM